MNHKEIIQELLGGSELKVNDSRLYKLSSDGLVYRYEDDEQEIRAHGIGFLLTNYNVSVFKRGIKEELLDHFVDDISNSFLYRNLNKLLNGEAIKFEGYERYSIRLMSDNNLLFSPSKGDLESLLLNKNGITIKRRI